MDELLQIEDVLLPSGLVEPELLLQRLPRLLGRVRHPGKVRHGAARGEPEEDEVDRYGDEHRHERERRAL
jgi:hypothetical protein